METSSSTPPKKGLGPVAWIGIGCGGIIALVVIAVLVVTMMYGGKIKQITQEAQTNPTRAVASVTLAGSMGQMEMAAEDDENKRYTLREKRSGKLVTIYWDEKKREPQTIEGDFSAIPAPTAAPEQPEAEQPESSAPADAPEAAR